MDTKEVRTNLLIERLSKAFPNNNERDLTDIKDLSPEKILVIAPHADDEVIGCGAAIDYFAQRGVDVCVLVVTKESERSIAKAYNYTPEQRIIESYLAKSVMGYNDLIYFDFPELKLRKDQALQNKFCHGLSAFIHIYSPDCIFIPNAKEMHPDHQVIGRLSHQTISEGVREQKFRNLETMLVYEIWGPVVMNSYLEISEEAYEKKIKSIQCYRSQTSSVDYEEIIQFLGDTRGQVLTETRQGWNSYDNVMAEGYKLYKKEELLNFQ